MVRLLVRGDQRKFKLQFILFFYFFIFFIIIFFLVSGTARHNTGHPIYLLIFTIEIWFTRCNNKYDVNMYIMGEREKCFI